MSKTQVWYKEHLAGTLEKTVEEFIFTYEDSYLASGGHAVSLTLPTTQKQFRSPDLFAFFDGLIPEGWLLNLASTQLRLDPLTDRYELLLKLCRHTIGASHIGEPGDDFNAGSIARSPALPAPESFGRCLVCYEDSPEIYHERCMLSVFGEKILPMVALDVEALEKNALVQLGQRRALGGVQKKLSLDLQSEGGKAGRLTIRDLWGRLIFKPRGVPPHLPENEHLCVRLAHAAGIQVEKAALIPTPSGELGFIATRFDRDQNHREYHQEDFCQILDKLSYKKYVGSLEQVGKKIRLHADFPGENLFRLYELTIFNFLIGNVDCHLKNLSLTYEDETGVRTMLSPAYDILSTDLFIADDNEESALAINGKKNDLGEADFLALAEKFGIGHKVHVRLMRKFRELQPEWKRLIDRSFLEPSKKEEFKLLIGRKLEKFSEPLYRKR